MTSVFGWPDGLAACSCLAGGSGNRSGFLPGPKLETIQNAPITPTAAAPSKAAMLRQLETARPSQSCIAGVSPGAKGAVSAVLTE